MSKLHFTKMHGTGNDYVYVNLFTEQVDDASKLAVFVSDRHFGIGSDGLILIAPSKTADCRMICIMQTARKVQCVETGFAVLQSMRMSME